MKTRIKSFFARIRQHFLMWRVEREIYGKIFPHLNHETQAGYPFQNDDEFMKESVRKSFEAQYYLSLLDLQIASMGKAYGQAFEYIMYRDLNRRMLRYVRLVQRRVSPEHRVAEYVR